MLAGSNIGQQCEAQGVQIHVCQRQNTLVMPHLDIEGNFRLPVSFVPMAIMGMAAAI